MAVHFSNVCILDEKLLLFLNALYNFELPFANEPNVFYDFALLDNVLIGFVSV